VRLIDLLVEEVAETEGRFDAKTPPVSDSAVAVYCNEPVRSGGRNGPLHLAAAKGHEAACLRLLAYGARPDVPNAQGQTPLHRASAAGQVLVIAALLEQLGVSETGTSLVNLADRTEDRQTALHLAAEDGHLDAVRLLCELGHANPLTADAHGRTALQLARTEAIRDYLSSYTDTAYSLPQ
jgi:ankyrin repeat protein